MSQSGVILPPENDPDPTDRLPELDLESADGSGDAVESTGTWAEEGRLADAVAVERVRELEDRLAGHDAALADLASRLTQKTFALTRAERDLELARADLQAAGDAASRLQERLRDEEQARQAVEAARDEQLETIAGLENELSMARETEHRLAQKLDDHADRLLEAQEALSVAQDRLAGSEARQAELEEALTEAMGGSMTAVQRREFDQLREYAAGLKRAVAVANEEQAVTARELEELRRKLERRDSDAAAAMGALHDRDQRVELLLERLRNVEARRRIAADMRHAPPAQLDTTAGLESLSRELEAERSLRQALERAVEALQAERQRPQPAPVRRRLVRIDPGSEATYLLLPPRTSIGRTPDNDLQLRENYISRSHAVIKLGTDNAIIEDAGSRNGIFVNDHRVRRELLHDGDLVVLGKARFRFEAAASPED